MFSWEILAQRAQLVKAAVPELRTMVTAEIEIVSAEHPELLGLIDIVTTQATPHRNLISRDVFKILLVVVVVPLHQRAGRPGVP